MAERAQPAQGQLWSVGGTLYRIESLNGTGDVGYPILLIEAARDVRELAQERATVANRHESRPTLAEALEAFDRPRKMHQDADWFRFRPDAALWNGTAAEWLSSREVRRD